MELAGEEEEGEDGLSPAKTKAKSRASASASTRAKASASRSSTSSSSSSLTPLWSGIEYLTPIDRKRKPIPKRYTTQKVSDALDAYCDVTGW